MSEYKHNVTITVNNINEEGIGDLITALVGYHYILEFTLRFDTIEDKQEIKSSPIAQESLPCTNEKSKET